MSGTVWYINWQDGSTVKLLAGHGKKVNLISRGACHVLAYTTNH